MTNCDRSSILITPRRPRREEGTTTFLGSCHHRLALRNSHRHIIKALLVLLLAASDAPAEIVPIEIVAPTEHSTVAGPIPVAATAGPYVTALEFVLDGTPVWVDNSAPFTWVFKTWTVPNGNHVIAAQKPGYPQTAKQVSVWVDNQPSMAGTPVIVRLEDTLTMNGTFKGFGIVDGANNFWYPTFPENQPHTTQYGTSPPVLPGPDFVNHALPRLAALKPSFVLKYVLMWTWAPSAPPDPYDWTNAQMQGVYQDLTALRTLGVDVMIVFTQIPTWIVGSGEFPNTPAEFEAWSSVVADLIKHLHGADGSGLSFTNVKWVGGPVELEGIAWPASGGMWQVREAYSRVGQKLSPYGITPKFFAPGFYDVLNPNGPFYDLAGQYINATQAEPGLDSLLAVYDWHLWYHSMSLEANNYSQIPQAIDAVRTAAGDSSKQVFNTEFGDWLQGNNVWQLTPLTIIEGVNRGQAMIVNWQLTDTNYGGPYPGTGGLLNTAYWNFWPKEANLVYQMISSHVKRDSLVFSSNCVTSPSECPKLKIAAFRSPQSAYTVFAYNTDLAASQRINVAFEGLPVPEATLYRYLVTPGVPLDIRRFALGHDSLVSLWQGHFTDLIPAGSFAVYSWEPDPQPPTVGITTPAWTQTVCGTIPVAATAESAGPQAIDRVEWLIDGTLYTTTYPPNHSWSWNTTLVHNGTYGHRIEAKAFDTAGRAATAMVWVTVANPSCQ